MIDASLHIILPAYNPEPGWQDRLTERLQPVYDILKEKYGVSITLVNDGGKPLIWNSHSLPLQIITHDENRGKGAAIRTALQHAEMDLVLITDIDIPYVEGDMLKVVQELSAGREVVVGIRKPHYFVSIPQSRKWISKSLIFFNKWLLRMKYPDTQAGIKGVSGRGIDAIKASKVSGFLYEVEWVRKAEKQKLNMSSIQVSLRKNILLSGINGKKLHQQVLSYLRLLLGR